MKIVRFLLGLGLAGMATATDWPRYLGPNGDGKVAGELTAEPEGEPLWTAEIGRGCSGFAVAEGKAVVMGNIDNTDIIWCFDAASGEVLWKYEYPEDLAPKYFDGGPHVTPSIDGEVVYTLSRTGNLFCLSMADGKPVWHQHYQTDFGGEAPTWGYAAAPIVRGDDLWCVPCGDQATVFVLDKASGEVKWKFGDDDVKSGYSAPEFFDYQGRDALALFHGRELVLYDLSDGGKRILSFPWRTTADVNASNPQYHDGKMFLASGYGMGYAVIDVSTGEPEILHRDRDQRLIFQNSILEDGDVIGVFGDKNLPAELIRMDLASGEVRWKVAMPGSRGSCLMVGDTLVVLTETGEVITGKAGRDAWEETGRVKALDGTCWAPVAFADGKVFVRGNLGKVACLTLGGGE